MLTIVFLLSVAQASGSTQSLSSESLERIVASVAKTHATDFDLGVQLTGTAFLVSAAPGEVHFVTNAHVLASGNGLVLFGERWKADAEVVAIDESNDLALLKVTQFSDNRLLPQELIPLQFEDALEEGDALSLLGYAYGDLHADVAVTRGNVLEIGESRVVVGARASHGNSGGPAIDKNGKVVGVLVSGRQGAGENRNNLIPARVVRAFLKRALPSGLKLTPWADPKRPNNVAPPLRTECLLAFWSGNWEVQLAMAVDRKGGDVALNRPIGFYSTLEMIDHGRLIELPTARVHAKGRSVFELDPEWDCAPLAKDAVSYADAAAPLWRVALPQQWSTVQDAVLTPLLDPSLAKTDQNGVIIDALGRVVLARNVQPTVHGQLAMRPTTSFYTMPLCELSVEVAAPKVEVRAELRVERKNGKRTVRPVVIPAGGTTFSEVFPNCTQSSFEALVDFHVTEPEGPEYHRQVLLTRAFWVGGEGHGAALTDSDEEAIDVRFDQLLKLPPARSRPHYACAQHVIDGNSQAIIPVSSPARGQNQLGYVHNGFGALLRGSHVGNGRGIQFELSERCWKGRKLAAHGPGQWLAVYGNDVVIQPRRGPRVTIIGADGTIMTARASRQGGYDVLMVTRAQEMVIRHYSESGAFRVVEKIEGGSMRAVEPCVLDDEHFVWCHGGPLNVGRVPKGKLPVSAFSGCSPLLTVDVCAE